MFLNLVVLVPDDTSVCCEDLRVENCECKRYASALNTEERTCEFLVLGVLLLMSTKSHVQAQCGPHQIHMNLEFYVELILSKGFWNHVEKSIMSCICQRVNTSTRARLRKCYANRIPREYFHKGCFTDAVDSSRHQPVGL